MKSRQKMPWCGSPPRSNQKIAKLIRRDFRHSHQHPRIIQIVIGDVELLWSGAHHFLALFEIDANNQRLAILMQTREKFSLDLEGRSAVRGSRFGAGQSLGDLANAVEGYWFDLAFGGFHSVARSRALIVVGSVIPEWRATRLPRAIRFHAFSVKTPHFNAASSDDESSSRIHSTIDSGKLPFRIKSS